jgi:hypothetical protein
MKRILRWLLYLFIIVVVLAVAGVLLLDTVAKELLQSRLRAETGMDVRIGKLDISLLTPTVAMENLRLYSAPEFGGSPLLEVPDLFLEYDKEALQNGKLRFRLVRLTVTEADLIQNRQGVSNIQVIKVKGKAAAVAWQNRPKPIVFAGIDTLNLSFQKLRVSSLAEPGRAREVYFNLTNQVFTNINSTSDLTGIAVVLEGRAAAASPPGAPPVDLEGLFRQWLR